MPNKTGAVAGLFYGFAFGMGGIGAAALGHLADLRGIEYVYQVCSYLPLLGLFAIMLPEVHREETPLLFSYHPRMKIEKQGAHR